MCLMIADFTYLSNPSSHIKVVIGILTMYQARIKEGSKVSILAELERAWHRNQHAEFVYRAGLPYILLTEEKIEPDMFYLDYAYSDSPHTTVHSYLLDKDLTVVSKANFKRDLDKELGELANIDGPLPILSFLNGKFQLPIDSLPPIHYLKFPEIDDFQFGRVGFGRLHQSYKIQSDSISKDHCSFTHIKKNNTRQQKKFSIIKQKLHFCTPLSSQARRLTEELWSLIQSYASTKERYILCDLGSRNGTWVTKIDEQKLEVKEGLQYQFEGQNYSIHISKIFTSRDSMGESILEHNVRVQKHLEEFRKEVNWCYYEPAKKLIVLGPGEDMNKIGSKNSQKVDIVVLKIKYRDFHEFYFLGITQSSRKAFLIGSKQEIDVSPDEDQFPTLHGDLTLQSGCWSLKVLGGSAHKIWTKIPKEYPFSLNPHCCYKMRLGFTATFDIQFFNF